MTKKQTGHQRGFTVVEIIIVIVVIGVLATVSVIGFGHWQRSIISAQLKSDLNGVSSAMENYRTFNNIYPNTIPETFTPSEGVDLAGGSEDGGRSYCVDATSAKDSGIVYYIEAPAVKDGPQEGSCASRPIPPNTPTSLVATAVSSSKINLSWNSVVGATGYTIERSTSAVFAGATTTTVGSGTSAVSSGLQAATTYFYRIKATNSNGASEWSTSVSETTTLVYDSLPVASSIEGYWTSAPDGYLLEDGSAVSRSLYADLFAVIGTSFGSGDGSTTFNLPDSRGRTSVNRNSTDTEFSSLGQKTGSKTEQLIVAQLPSHTHTQGSHTHAAQGKTDAIGQASGWGGSDSGVRASTSSYTLYNQYVVVSAATATNQNTGGGEAHNNIQPSIVKTFAIKYRPPVGGESMIPAGTSIKGYWSSAPDGYLLEDGASISRTTYSDLFSAIGVAFGAGDGASTFNVPDSRGRAGVNRNSTDSEFDSVGEKVGTKREALTVAQMPSHTHAQNPHSHSAYGRTDAIGQASGWGGTVSGVRASTSSYTLYNQHVGIDATTATNQNTGNGEAHNNIQPSIVKTFAIKYTPATESQEVIPRGLSIEGYWSSAPDGYLLEDGSAISRTIYADLFAVIGTTFGEGDGVTTFNLPDSRGRLAVNLNPLDSEFNLIGKKYGAKVNTLTVAQMPSHTHIQNSHTHGAVGKTDAIGQASGWGGSDSVVRATTSSYTLDNLHINVGAATATNANTGGGGSHNNIQPSIVKLFVIKY